MPNHQNGAKMHHLEQTPVACSLFFIIYGPVELAEDVGNFFQTYRIYLQDPRGCIYDTKYINPHRLSSMDHTSCPMTSSLEVSDPLAGCAVQDVAQRPDLLEMLDSSKELAEAPQPDAVQTKLEK